MLGTLHCNGRCGLHHHLSTALSNARLCRGHSAGYAPASAGGVFPAADVVVVATLRPITQLSTSAFAVSGAYCTKLTKLHALPRDLSCSDGDTCAFNCPHPPTCTHTHTLGHTVTHRCACNGTRQGGALWGTSTGTPASLGTPTTTPPRRCGRPRCTR